MPSAITLVRWVNENAFVLEVQTRPCPTFGRPVHLGFPHRLRPGTSPHALRIPPHGGHPALRSTASGSPASEAINPAFGYGAPHLSARGTLTPLNNALLSAHFPFADDTLRIWLASMIAVRVVGFDRRESPVRSLQGTDPVFSRAPSFFYDLR